MIAAGDAIQIFAFDRPRPSYDSDLMFRSAVERQFEILGEALRRLEAADPVMAQRINDYRRIIDFRNVIAHGYDTIDSDIVWQVVNDKLPLLLFQAKQLLIELQSPP